MNKYELLYIINAQTSDEEKQVIIDKIEGIITSNNGTVDSVDKWGNRKFAFLINDKTEGYYVLTNFTANAEVPALIERQIQILDNTYRCMIIKK